MSALAHAHVIQHVFFLLQTTAVSDNSNLWVYIGPFHI